MFPFFVHCSSFVPLPVRLAPSFVRSLFVFCSFFVRSLFVFCSSFVRSLFVFCSSFVRLLFVFCSSFLYLPVWLAPSFVRLCVAIVPPLWGGRGRLPLSFHYPPVVLRLPVWLAPSFVRHSFVPLFRYYTPSPWERVGKRIFCSSACAACTICLSC